ncbi:thiamine-phosphate kinase [Agrococcus sp. TF02-05]|uniref:thiamine-phosphate kinase n=1 Tax=Agrococcus sp. TF02-05 TaxID=2815211 RepID=UPI001AA19031|nr:thiamine-phosphate kinase [Agrococcus sp. TF02-05]MBO1769377.1 thiamine-phosphate kinase [Agrococcus sp. TF02-05]
MDDVTLADVGELEALRRFLPLLPSGDATIVGPGDDAAVVRAPDGRFVVTTDTMLEGADLRLDWSSWHDLGWKAAASNLADIAAMGAVPTSLVVALAVPRATLVRDLERFAEGLADGIAAMAPGCGVVGGDLGTAERVTIAVTAFGDLRGADAVLRSGARAGDRVCAVGTLGMSATGLGRLLAASAEAGGTLEPGAAERLAADDATVRIHLAPTAPVAAGPALAAMGATALLDVSDGLALDAARVARASAARIAIDGAAVDALAARLGIARDAVLHGGEDHALLVTLPPSIDLPTEVAGAPLTELGVVEAGEGVTLDGAPLEPRGWDPYRA